MDSIENSGTLSDIPCPRLLTHLHRSRFAGTLRIAQGATLKLLYFQDGEIAMASSNHREDHLAPLLIAQGKLKSEQLELARRSSRPGTTLARVLVQMGFLTSNELFAGARLQLRRIVGGLLTVTDAQYEIQPGFFPRQVVSLNVDTQEMLLDLLREIPDRAFILSQVGPPDTSYQASPPGEGEAPPPLTGIWKSYLTRMPDALTVHQFGEMAGLDDFTASKAVYALSLMRCLKPVPLDLPSLPSGGPSPELGDLPEPLAPTDEPSNPQTTRLTPSEKEEAGWDEGTGPKSAHPVDSPSPPVSDMSESDPPREAGKGAPSPPWTFADLESDRVEREEPLAANSGMEESDPSTDTAWFIPGPKDEAEEKILSSSEEPFMPHPAEGTEIPLQSWEPPEEVISPQEMDREDTISLSIDPGLPAGPDRENLPEDEDSPGNEPSRPVERDSGLKRTGLEHTAGGEVEEKEEEEGALVAHGKPICIEYDGTFGASESDRPPRSLGRGGLGLILIGILGLGSALLWFFFLRDASSGQRASSAPAVTSPLPPASPGQGEDQPQASSRLAEVSSPPEIPNPVLPPDDFPVETPPLSRSDGKEKGPLPRAGDGPPFTPVHRFEEARAQFDQGKFKEAGMAWRSLVEAAEGGQYTLQLAIVCQESTLRQAAATTQNLTSFFAVPFSLQGRSCYRLCWQTYSTVADAQAARFKVPSFFLQDGTKPVVVSLDTLTARENR